MNHPCADNPDKRHNFAALLVKQTANPDGTTLNQYVTYCTYCGETLKVT